MPKIDLDDEELQAVIDFNEAMAEQATDSCEYEEAKERKARAKNLKRFLVKSPGSFRLINYR